MNGFLPSLLLPLSIASLLMSAQANTWHSADGASLEADFVSLKGDQLKLAIQGGTELTFEIATFAAEDQEYAQGIAEGTIIRPGGIDVLASVENQLLMLEGTDWKPFEITNDPHYILLYYSASWCGPCRAAAPKNVELYKEVRSSRGDFEMIWVSADRQLEPMLQWAVDEQFPWPTIGLNHVQNHPLMALAENFVPYYLLVDQGGNKLAEGHDEVFAYLAANPPQSTAEDKATGEAQDPQAQALQASAESTAR